MGEAFTVKVVITTQLTTIKTHGHVSAAKKDVLHAGALSTGINKEPFSTPYISTTPHWAGLHQIYKFNALHTVYMTLCTNLKKFSSVVHEIFILEKCLIFSHFSLHHLKN